MSDEEWEFFEPFASGAARRSGRPPVNHRLVLGGIFWIARTGAPWRDLHVDFGAWNSVYRQFRRWTLAGVWDVMLEALNDSGTAQASLQMIDSTIVRAHQHAGGRRKGGPETGPEAQDLGRSRGGFATKIHIRTNALGIAVAITLSPGETSDMRGYGSLMDEAGPAPKVLLADKSYGSDAIRDDLDTRGIVPVIAYRRNRLVKPPIDGFIYALRNQIERCFNKLKHSRRFATRYDKTSSSFLSFTLLASIRIWIRHFVRST